MTTDHHTDHHTGRPHVTLIANPYSVHVARWLKLYRLAEIDVRIETAEAPQSGSTVEVPIEFLVPAWFRGPAFLRYLWAGLAAARRPRTEYERLHAHCTSGSGFAAWLSRRPYVVTTYGSEVFGAAGRGRLYRWMIQRVLSGASLVTATTPRMTATLQQEFGVPAQRIRTFSVGYDGDVFHPADDDRKLRLRSELNLPADERIWIINRRSLSLYRTVEVVSGFLQFCSRHAAGRLVVLSGDDDPDYSHQLHRVIDSSRHAARVRMIRDFLPAVDVARRLQAADFAISVPKTDQLSTSILEAMACATVPVLATLEAYHPLRQCSGIHWVSDYSIEGFAKMFARTATVPANELRQRQRQCAAFADAHYAETRILDHVRALYSFPAHSTSPCHRAA